MSTVVTLCHFCDIHGPSVLLSSFPVHQVAPLTQTPCDQIITCKACEMAETYSSTDSKTKTCYKSSRLPWQQPDLCAWLQHVCLRSLSCEVNPCIFGEPPNCALSISFSLKDATARGFSHWFSIVISSRDLTLLVSLWPFYNRIVQIIISHLQDKCLEVYNVERSECVINTPQTRNLIQLTRNKYIFARLHCWFTWLIRAGANRICERIPVSPFLKTEPQGYFDQGNLRALRVFLGEQLFDLAMLNILEGRQVIIRGDILPLVQGAVETLRNLVPTGWCDAVEDSEEYVEESRSKLLGVGTHVAVPRPCNNIVRVDIVQGMVLSKTTAVMPDKCPTLFTKTLRAIENMNLKQRALEYHLLALQREWLNIAKLMHKTRFQNNANLLLALGVKEQDQTLLQFWTNKSCVL